MRGVVLLCRWKQQLWSRGSSRSDHGLSNADMFGGYTRVPDPFLLLDLTPQFKDHDLHT
jgi:hypothetical protein